MKVLLDACVLYPTVMREVLIGAARAGLYQPLWSARILEEWARAAKRIDPLSEMQARAEVALLRAAFPKAEVGDYAHIEPRLYLPDAGDLHVLAAAVRGSADLIITMNAKDFPRHTLAEEDLDRRDPDQFMMQLYADNPDAVAQVVADVHGASAAMDDAPRALRALMKKARMPRLGKLLG